ncbi:hypothetical protein BC832DRAFT_38661 [Gaertneriomyces semiglobifer]|nr:hypothetical protein BC832DRAFT_38661 [Gaertneriomyces semiglobifer]
MALCPLFAAQAFFLSASIRGARSSLVHEFSYRLLACHPSIQSRRPAARLTIMPTVKTPCEPMSLAKFKDTTDYPLCSTGFRLAVLLPSSVST